MTVNLLGAGGYEGSVRYEGIGEILALEGAHLHLYGKKETRPNRKMGHVTVLDRDIGRAYEKALQIKQHLRVIA